MKNIKEILLSSKIFNGITVENLMVLDYVWKNDMKEFSSFCDIYSIEKKTLVLKTKNPIIKKEFFIKKDMILKNINKYFKNRFIKDIRFI